MKPLLKPIQKNLLVVLIGLSLLVLAAYGGITSHGFIHYDDPAYLTENRHVQGGWTLEGFLWAFQTTTLANWHPLTWLSHMLDWQLFGARAGGHHWTSVILHLVSGLVLFWVLYRMTAAIGRSALVAALFLIHPLHVESVAWAAERKDVLSGLFWMLGLWGYVRYSARPCRARYAAVVLFFVLGLLSKPMVVTFPFVLILLDWWPLRRLGVERGDWRSRLYEKAPLFILSGISSVVTFLVQRAGEAVMSLGTLSLMERLANALVTYGRYMIKTLWPVELAVFYPHPGQWPLQDVLLSLAALGVITAAVVVWARRYPYGVVGWFWYLGTLVPVIGLIQVGGQAMADRYTYLPLTGIFVALVWGLGDLFRSNKFPEAGKILAVAIVLALTAVTHWHLGFWRDSETLFTRALQVTEGNAQALNNLGKALVDQGAYGEAEERYREAIRISPTYMPAYNNLGVALLERGHLAEAEDFLNRALALKPGDGSVLYNLGQVFSRRQRWTEAVKAYRAAMETIVDHPSLHNNLGLALIHQGDLEKAAKAFREAIRLAPDHAGAHNNLAMLLLGRGETAEAADHFRKAIAAVPSFANAHYCLGRLLMSRGNTEEGEAHLRRAEELVPGIGRADTAP